MGLPPSSCVANFVMVPFRGPYTWTDVGGRHGSLVHVDESISGILFGRSGLGPLDDERLTNSITDVLVRKVRTNGGGWRV